MYENPKGSTRIIADETCNIKTKPKRNPKRVQYQVMGTYTQIFYHIIFSKKNRERVLVEGNREKLFKYIGGIIEIRSVFIIKLMELTDHLHIAPHLQPHCCFI